MQTLLAQIPTPETSPPPLSSFALLMLCLPSFLLVFGLAFMAFRYHKTRREMEHAERMQALSLGIAVPERESSWAKAFVCSSIGVGVPAVAFVFTGLFMENRPYASGLIWLVPGVVSCLSVGASTSLAKKLFRHRENLGEVMAHLGLKGDSSIWDSRNKPAMDPDAYDVAGRRG